MKPPTSFSLAGWQLARRRKKALSATRHAPLRTVLEASLPAPSTPFRDVPFLCLDFETTGLDPARDHILSIGCVPIVGGTVQLGAAHYWIVDFAGTLDEETLAIHGLTHDDLADGIPLAQAIDGLLGQMPGVVMVAHQASIERQFLSAATQALYGAACETLWVCTLTLERQRLKHMGEHLSVRLSQSRERYNLPRYKAHHALMDAFAGGELLLAQAAHIGGDRCKLAALV
ncbi:MAG: exonuclease domain-containing protein [Pseudomonadota bacterium]